MLYILGANTLDHYTLCNHESAFGPEASRGFARLGIESVVLWGGGNTVVDGVTHAPYAGDGAPRLGPHDTVLVMHSLLGADVATLPAYERLRGAGRRWLWASCTSHTPDGKLEFRDAWAWYQHIWIECPGGVAQVAKAIPTSRVRWCLMGCPSGVDAAVLSDPYPADGRRHLFFAGRVHDAGWLRRLVSALPDRYSVWCAAPIVVVDPLDRAAGEFAGHSYLIGRVGEAIQDKKTSPRDGSLELVSAARATEIVTAIVPDPRFRWLGALPFGTFWHYHHHAFASLDHGFSSPSVLPINSKIIDPLTVGGRVAADGHSPSFYLLGRYAAGKVVRHNDAAALASALEAWNTEPRAAKLARAETFRRAESWEVRTQQMVADAGRPG